MKSSKGVEAHRSLWSLEEGVDFCRRLNKRLMHVGYVVALTGSVLFKGKSHKDLDLIVYPMSTSAVDLEALRGALTGFGIRPWIPVEEVHERWRKLGSTDTKHCEIWRSGIRRIDLFFLK